jgi:hypothetical protein
VGSAHALWMSTRPCQFFVQVTGQQWARERGQVCCSRTLLVQSGHRADPHEDEHNREYAMNDKPIPLVQVRNQRLFGPKAAARYLGICEDTLKKITDLEQIRAFNMNGRRAYRLEDLEAYVESLPGWYDSTGEKSAKVVGDRRVS